MLAGVLIAGAFLLPSGLFAAQDEVRAKQSTIGVRSRVSLDNLGENYEKSRHNRMSILAERLDGNNAVYVSESEVTMTETERDKYLEAAFYEERRGYSYEIIYRYLAYYLFHPETEGRSASWKRYVIYDAQGILLVCYYIDIFSDAENEIQFLVDAEDKTIYYMQKIYHGQNTLEERGLTMGDIKNTAITMELGVNRKNLSDRDYADWLFYWESFYLFLIDYEVDFFDNSGYREGMDYEADILSKATELYHNNGNALALRLQEQYTLVWGDALWVPLTYGEAQIVCEINDGSGRIYGDDGRAEFFFGFPVLAELIPEYAAYELEDEDKVEDNTEYNIEYSTENNAQAS